MQRFQTPTTRSMKLSASTVPLVLLDVDGVVNSLKGLWGEAENEEEYDVFVAVTADARYEIWLHGDTKELVQNLNQVAEVLWCTTWRKWANGNITDKLEIPWLGVVDDGDDFRHTKWKWPTARPVVEAALAEGRKILWIEDFEGSHLPHIEEGEPWNKMAFLDTADQDFELREIPVQLWEWLLN